MANLNSSAKSTTNPKLNDLNLIECVDPEGGTGGPDLP